IGRPASAKGPSKLVVTGPGFASPVVLDTVAGWELFQDAGGFAALDCGFCDGMGRHRPSQDLGPRYTVTYTMESSSNHQTRSNQVVQYLYPDASPAPVTHVPAGQRFWQMRTPGTWFTA